MIWICRAGANAQYLDYYHVKERVFLPWDGFKKDLTLFITKEDLKRFVSVERQGASDTAIATWAGQLRAFSQEMKQGDLVLIPHQRSRQYTLSRIISDYCFTDNDPKNLWHSRRISILEKNIPRSVFSQSLQYSMGAYRTVFKIRNLEELSGVLHPFMIDQPLA